MAEVKGPVFNPASDLKAIMLIVALMWLFWLSTGGPEKYEEKQPKPFLTVPEKIGYDEESDSFKDPVGDQYGSIPKVEIGGNVSLNNGVETGGISGNNTNSNGQNGTPTSVNKGAGSDGGSDDKTSVKPADSSTVSSGFFKKSILSLERVSKDGANQQDPNQKSPQADGYFKLNFPTSNGAPLRISGLLIKNIFGKVVTIPGASYLPYQGMINEEREILAGPGSTIYLIQGPSPVGVSFRVNKCMLHLEKYQNFYPPLYRQDYAGQAPVGETYNVCVEAHKNDPDFFLNDWRIYFDKTDISWLEKASFIRIIDSSGKTLVNSFY